MLVDRTHRVWMTLTLLLFVLATLAYVADVRSSPHGARGGSFMGMVFGLSGSLLMIFAGLLSARKRFPRLNLGSAQGWLRGHIWLGLLAGPLIFFHAAFRWGGLLERIIMVLMIVIIVSGLVGLMLQQLLPRLLATTVGAEAMREQVPHVCAMLKAAGDEAITASCGAAIALSPGEPMSDPKSMLAMFYRQQVRPFLAFDLPRDSNFVATTSAAAAFAAVRERLPESLRDCVDKLQKLCDERRQLLLQTRLQSWLRGWLLIHVPLSVVLLVLGALHAVMAVCY